VAELRTDRRDPSTRIKPSSLQLCPAETPHSPIWEQNRAGALEDRHITA
jgi:hypothetical protein